VLLWLLCYCVVLEPVIVSFVSFRFVVVVPGKLVVIMWFCFCIKFFMFCFLVCCCDCFCFDLYRNFVSFGWTDNCLWYIFIALLKVGSWSDVCVVVFFDYSL